MNNFAQITEPGTHIFPEHQNSNVLRERIFLIWWIIYKRETDLVDYLQERFHVMNIKLILIAGTDVYKIQFPSEEMYKLAVAGMLERFFKLIVPV